MKEQLASLETQAQRLHEEVQILTRDLATRWERLVRLLAPIHMYKLWKILGYRSWEDYVELVVKEPVTSVNNRVLPVRNFLAVGYTDEDLDKLKDVRPTHFREISELVRQSGKRLPEAELNRLVELARRSKTRNDSKAFHKQLAVVAAASNIEPTDFIRIPAPKSFVNQFNYALKVSALMLAENSGKHKVEDFAKVTLLENIIAAFLMQEETQQFITRLPDDEFAALERLLSTAPVEETVRVEAA